jgi:hypothetical protein
MTTGECGIFKLAGKPHKLCKKYMLNKIHDRHGKNGTQKEEDSFHQQMGLNSYRKLMK